MIRQSNKYDQVQGLNYQLQLVSFMHWQITSKSQLYRELRQLLSIRDNYQSIALDCNNLLGRALYKLEQIAAECVFAPEHKRRDFYPLLQKQGDLIINSFFEDIKPVLDHFERQNIYAVFDGRKLAEKFEKKYFDWKLPPKPKREPHSFNPRKPSGKTQTYWIMYRKIMEMVKLVLYALNIRIIEAPYDADHQITKMYDEGFIQCVYSTDYDYVDYAVPLVKTFRPDGTGLVIDFNKTDLDRVDSEILRRWVEATRENTFRRMCFGLYCGSPYIQSFQALPILQIMQTMLNASVSNIFHELTLKRPEIYIPKDYILAVGELCFIVWCGTCYSLKNDKLQPLHYAKKDKLKPIYEKLGQYFNYKSYTPGQFRIGAIEGLDASQVQEWVYQNQEWLWVRSSEIEE